MEEEVTGEREKRREEVQPHLGAVAKARQDDDGTARGHARGGGCIRIRSLGKRRGGGAASDARPLAPLDDAPAGQGEAGRGTASADARVITRRDGGVGSDAALRATRRPPHDAPAAGEAGGALRDGGSSGVVHRENEWVALFFRTGLFDTAPLALSVSLVSSDPSFIHALEASASVRKYTKPWWVIRRERG
jgi:hypothetical protein